MRMAGPCAALNTASLKSSLMSCSFIAGMFQPLDSFLLGSLSRLWVFQGQKLAFLEYNWQMDFESICGRNCILTAKSPSPVPEYFSWEGLPAVCKAANQGKLFK